jgi:hypothetical protein
VRLVRKALADAPERMEATQAAAADDDQVDVLRRLGEGGDGAGVVLLEVGRDAPHELELGVPRSSGRRDGAHGRAGSA